MNKIWTEADVENAIYDGAETVSEISNKLKISCNTTARLVKKIVPEGLRERKLDKIRKAIEQGYNYPEEISRIAGIGVEKIKYFSRIYKLGVKKKSPGKKEFLTDADRRHQCSPKSIFKDKLIREGYSINELAKTLDVSRQCISQYIQLTGQSKIWEESKGRRFAQEERDYDIIVSAINKGYLGDKEIAKKTGLSYIKVKAVTEEIAAELGKIYGIKPRSRRITKEEKKNNLKVGRAIEKGILETDLIAWEASLPYKEVSRIVNNIVYAARQKYKI